MGLFQTVGTVAGNFFGGGPAGGAIGGAIGSSLDGAIESDRASGYNSAEAVSAYMRSRQGRQTAYQDTVGDMRAAGLNPMLAYSQGPTNMSGSASATYPTGAGAAVQTASAATSQASTARDIADQTIKTETFRTAIAQNDAIKGNYALMQLAGALDAAVRVTGEVGTNALSALEVPRIRAGLQELRAAFASAKNDADVYEALNSKAVNIALDALGKLTGSGGIAGAVDRYRARSQRGDIINLNKD